jgi:K+-transporting ATPase ATPase B chain
LITALWLQALFGQGEAATWFIGVNALWLWFTVLFANFAEAMAEGRSKAQAASLRSLQKRCTAKKLPRRATASSPWDWSIRPRCASATCWSRPAT